MLPEKVTEKVISQVGDMVKTELKLHESNCVIKAIGKTSSAADNHDDEESDNKFLKWVIKNQMQILVTLALVAATYFGVKP